MTSANFDCPACGQNLESPVEMEGRVIECPACEARIVLPGPGGQGTLAAELQAVESPAEEPLAEEAVQAPEEEPAGEQKEEVTPAARAGSGGKKIILRASGGKTVLKRPDRPSGAARLSAPAVPRAADERSAGSTAISPGRRSTALLLFLFLGVLGVHRYYVGKIGTGLLFMFSLGGFGIWGMADLVMITSGMFRDKQGRLLKRW
jgi:DNA-directed RNA polymerase subunit RPC12/RpoP